MQHSCCAGFVFVRGLVAIHGIVVVVCGSQCRSAMPPAATADSLGSGDAWHQGATPFLGSICPSAIVAISKIFAILVSLMPITVLSLAFALPDTIVTALFVRSGHVVVSDVIIRSCYMQHCCNARLCCKVPKMTLSAILLPSLFSSKKGNGNGTNGGM
jgi:hypothetical protein